MNIWGLIIGGAAGLAVGGPIGALLGAAAGVVAEHQIRRRSDLDQVDRERIWKRSCQQRRRS